MFVNPTALLALVCIGLGIDFALVREGRFKIGEKTLGDIETPAISQQDPSITGSTKADPAMSHRPGGGFLPLWFEDAMEVLIAVRGIGWDFGDKVYVPHQTRPLEKRPFLLATLENFLWSFIMLDFLEACLKLVPGVGSPRGGTIFFPGLPPLSRYFLSTCIHVATGTAFIAGFDMVYDLIVLFCVGVLGHVPSSWPPVMHNPWAAQSLHEFWAKRWHQLLRHTFLIYGGYPGYFVAGKAGLLIGTFLASGLYHECSMYSMGRGWDNRPIIFFLIQAIAILLEKLWRNVTGRRVKGIWGRSWVYFCIMVLGQQCGELSFPGFFCHHLTFSTRLVCFQWTHGIRGD